MEQLTERTIIVSGHTEARLQNGSIKHTILDENQKKYEFFETKKDGKNTVAWDQYQNIKIGQQVGIKVRETEGSINPHTNKPYKNFTIVSFQTTETPSAQPEPQKSVYVTREEFKALETRVAILEVAETKKATKAEADLEEVPF